MFQAATDTATAAQSSIQPQPQMSSASIIDHHIQQGAAAVASSQLPSPAIRASSSNNNNFNPNSFNPHLQHNNPVTFEVVPSSSGIVTNLSYPKKQGFWQATRQQSIWPCHENRLTKMITIIPHKLWASSKWVPF